jgi:hypothetical protein
MHGDAQLVCIFQALVLCNAHEGKITQQLTEFIRLEQEVTCTKSVERKNWYK